MSHEIFNIFINFDTQKKTNDYRKLDTFTIHDNSLLYSTIAAVIAVVFVVVVVVIVVHFVVVAITVINIVSMLKNRVELNKRWMCYGNGKESNLVSWLRYIIRDNKVSSNDWKNFLFPEYITDCIIDNAPDVIRCSVLFCYLHFFLCSSAAIYAYTYSCCSSSFTSSFFVI